MESQHQNHHEEQHEAEHHDENTTLYITVLFPIYLVVAFVSIVIFLGLLIPLALQLKNGTYHHQPKRPSRSISRTRDRPVYSTYNVYLVYLAFLDLVYSIPMMVAFWTDFAGRIGIVLYPYILGNLSINAFIAYELLLLLKASHKAQRITQPNLTRVNLQGGSVVLGTLLWWGFTYYAAFDQGIDRLYFSAFIVLCCILFIYAIGVTILVQWKGYMPSSKRSSSSSSSNNNNSNSNSSSNRLNTTNPIDRAVRELTIYFFRITIVFVAIWLPVGILHSLQSEQWGCMSDIRINIVIAIQPILTFVLVLTKSDVKKYITDLVTLAYIFGNNCCTKAVEAAAERETNKISGKIERTEECALDENDNDDDQHSQYDMENSVTMLGYTFPCVGGDATDGNEGVESNDKDDNIDGDNEDPGQCADSGGGGTFAC